jgi:hypothetical protein
MSKSSKMSAMALDAYVRSLEQTFGSSRLESFNGRTGDKLEMVTNYFWNVALCKELYLSLGTVEVAMRNAIHGSLMTKFKVADWYDHPGLTLLSRERESISKAKGDIREAGRPIIPGRVVAAVTFGFWTNLLSAPYGNSPRATPL